MGQGFLRGQGGGKKVASGSFTPSSSITTPYTISGLGFNPTGGMLLRPQYMTAQYTWNYLQMYDSIRQIGAYGTANATAVPSAIIGSNGKEITFGQGSITFYGGSGEYQLDAGRTYYWWAWAED